MKPAGETVPSLADLGFEPTNLAQLPMPTGASGAHQLFEDFVDRIERYVRQDPVLVHRLLVRVNSAGYGLSREIESLRHALMMIGFGALDVWLGEQLAASEEADSALHPVRYGMVMRARLAQHLLDSGSDDNLRSEVFLTALFAQLDRLLHKAHVLNIKGRSYRLRDLEATLGTARH